MLNVASVAGFLPGPGSAVYYASKAYVLSFSEALHQRAQAEGVRVTCLCPGPVATEFQARAGVAGDSRCRGRWRVSAERVARAGYRGLMRGRRLVVPGLANSVVVTLRAALRAARACCSQLDGAPEHSGRPVGCSPVCGGIAVTPPRPCNRALTG